MNINTYKQKEKLQIFLQAVGGLLLIRTGLSVSVDAGLAKGKNGFGVYASVGCVSSSGAMPGGLSGTPPNAKMKSASERLSKKLNK